MASVFDVAQYILEKLGTVTAMKLQKLCYYSQAWSLVWDEEPLFNEDIKAWANGPVVVRLYVSHRGHYKVSSLPRGKSDNLSVAQKETIDKVISFYDQFNSQQLSDLTHQEYPWRKARAGLADGERGREVISHDSMAAYYASL